MEQHLTRIWLRSTFVSPTPLEDYSTKFHKVYERGAEEVDRRVSNHLETSYGLSTIPFGLLGLALCPNQGSYVEACNRLSAYFFETSLMKIPTETPLRGVAVRSGLFKAEVW